MQKVIFIYTTFPSKEQAVAAARTLLEQRMVGCVNLLPITSMFQWEGVIQNEEEIGMLCKTVKEVEPQAIELLQQLHPYKVACIASISVDVNAKFAEWLRGTCLD